MKPLLSIGMIFKNEIRCLERCLKSLDTLRKVIPCELVMADTGSDDGSREVAEKYADILFDFVWTYDFSAARNAVIDRCSGEWYLSIDADEWLDEDITPLVEFLKNGKYSEPVCGLKIRNYAFSLTDGRYTEFLAVRLLRLSTGLRYTGKIHEHWEHPDGRELHVYPLGDALLHHDGYIMLNDGSEAGRKKLRRNMQILKGELDADPNNMLLLIQCIESCGLDYDAQMPYVQRGVKLVREKQGGWAERGANLLHYAIHAAHKRGMPEFGAWLALAEAVFPNSVYTTVEAQFDAVEHAWCDMNCEELIFRGRQYLKGMTNYREGRFDVNEMLQSPLKSAKPYDENSVRICVARAQIYEGQPEDAFEMLEPLDYNSMDAEQTGALLETLLRLHTLSWVDTEPFLLRFWEKINETKPSQEMSEERRKSFIMGASIQFSSSHMRAETSRMNGETSLEDIGEIRAEEWNVLSELTPCRHGYTLFKPLAGQLEIGTAAVLMDEKDPETAAQLLSSVERFNEFPIQALTRALLLGVVFPLPDKPLNIEEMDEFAVRLAQDKGALRTLAERSAAEDFAGNWQALLWTRGLVLSAVRSCEWEDEARDIALAKIFARVERAFLTAYYAPEVLREGNLCVLPSMHRFGWHCAEAFAALESGDAAGYARFLREGLVSCPAMKSMVEFLSDHTPELQAPSPDPELLALAEKVRMMLAAYSPDDPAIAALKASPVYQKVAYLIEGE